MKKAVILFNLGGPDKIENVEEILEKTELTEEDKKALTNE